MVLFASATPCVGRGVNGILQLPWRKGTTATRDVFETRSMWRATTRHLRIFVKSLVVGTLD